MALNKSALKASIKTALQNAIGVEDNFDTLAQNIADAVDTFVKSGTVNTQGLQTSDGATVTQNTNVT